MIDKRFQYVVTFNADEFMWNEIIFQVTATTGLDIDNNRIQLRDDTIIVNKKTKKMMPFSIMLRDWDRIESLLIRIIKRGGFIRRQ